MAKALLIAFEPAELELCAGFADALGCDCDALVVTGSVPPADGLAEALAPHCDGYAHVAGISNMCGKDVLARLAGVLDWPMVTDTTAVLGELEFERPIVAGALTATVRVERAPLVLTFRASSFPSNGAEPNVLDIDLNVQSRTERVSETKRGGARPDLARADVVVSGGRPLETAERFEEVIGGLADVLGGAVGATRAAVDSGIAPNDLQVGQTGKVVAPNLYIAAGISGSTQHVAGMKDSKLIIAINKDPDAPIFQVADLGIVGDLFEVIPQLKSKLAE